MIYSPDCNYSIRLLDKLHALPNAQELDFSKIKESIIFAKRYHSGQFRKSGEPFYSHPLEVAFMIVDYIANTNVIVASILHDVIEDTPVTAGIIVDTFGWRIAEMVDRLTRDRPDGTKLTVELILKNAWQKQDLEVILIKIIDRVHNIKTLNFMPVEKQKKQLTETIKNFLVFAEELNLMQLSDWIYKSCLNFNLELCTISNKPPNLAEESVLSGKPILPRLFG